MTIDSADDSKISKTWEEEGAGKNGIYAQNGINGFTANRVDMILQVQSQKLKCSNTLCQKMQM